MSKVSSHIMVSTPPPPTPSLCIFSQIVVGEMDGRVSMVARWYGGEMNGGERSGRQVKVDAGEMSGRVRHCGEMNEWRGMVAK